MTLNMGEIVTVTKHDHEGRILEFVKTPIPLGTAEEMKAAAFVENERKKDIALLRDAKALLASAKSINAKLAAKPVDDKPALQEPLALPPIKSAPQAALPAPAATRRPPALATRGVKKQKPNDLLNSKIEEATFVMSLMTACAERDGAQLGKSIIAQSLAPHKSNHAVRAEVSSEHLKPIVRNLLDQLRKQNYFAIKTPESRDAFVKAFLAGADAAVVDFNERKAAE
jgi:hypothetical protein